jgi:hypothetical protein
MLAEVSANVRAVTVRVTRDAVHFAVYFDSAPSDDELASVSEIEGGVINLLPEDNEVTCETIVLPYPELVPKDVLWAYHRYEGFPSIPQPKRPGSKYQINEGRQGRYIPGHRNFVPAWGGPILTHPDPQALIDEFAGREVAVGKPAKADAELDRTGPKGCLSLGIW